jgi:hypothetical protein
MQAGVVSTRLHWCDIFTAAGLCRQLRVVVARISVTVRFIDTGVLVDAGTKTGCLINSERRKQPHRPARRRGRRHAFVPITDRTESITRYL